MKYGLSEKQLRFAHEFALHGHASLAYRTAFDCKNRSASAVAVAANRMLRNRKIQTEIRAIRAESRQRLALEHERVLRELSVVAFGDPGDIFDESGEPRPYDSIPPSARRLIKKLKVLRSADGSESFEITLHNQLDALERLATALGLFADAEEVESLCKHCD